MKRFLPLLGVIFATCVPIPADAAEPFKLNDGDRVVFLGNTLIEREQRYGYWELALTTRFPDKNITFRNLGWAGDTVWGEARASFGTQADGFKQLKEHVASLKPTVIIVGYGNNEAFDGEAGLPHFLEGLNKLLDTLDENKARIVLLSPLRQEDMGRPLPDPTEQNKNIRMYRDAMKKVADKRGYAFVDLYERLQEQLWPKLIVGFLKWTDNGIHLTADGYRIGGVSALKKELGIPSNGWVIKIDALTKKAVAEGAKIVPDKNNALRFQITDNILPNAGAKNSVLPTLADDTRRLYIGGLPDGDFALMVDGKVVVIAPASDWATGVNLNEGPQFEQAEKLRAAIIEKNRLYFHRWRPQNETYLFGFRKHEQGQNAIEIPKFDPLIAKLEEEIAKLRVPVEHKYEIRAAKEGDK